MKHCVVNSCVADFEFCRLVAEAVDIDCHAFVRNPERVFSVNVGDGSVSCTAFYNTGSRYRFAGCVADCSCDGYRAALLVIDIGIGNDNVVTFDGESDIDRSEKGFADVVDGFALNIDADDFAGVNAFVDEKES